MIQQPDMSKNQLHALSHQLGGFIPEDSHMPQADQRFTIAHSPPISPIRQVVGKVEKDLENKYKPGVMRSSCPLKQPIIHPGGSLFFACLK